MEPGVIRSLNEERTASHYAKLLAVDINEGEHQVVRSLNSSVYGVGAGRYVIDDRRNIEIFSPEGTSASVSSSDNSGSRREVRGEKAPTLTAAHYSDTYRNTVMRVDTLECRGTVRYSRAAQVSGNFYTKMLTAGFVTTDGTFSVDNTLTIHVECELKEGGDGGGMNDDDEPGGGGSCFGGVRRFHFETPTFRAQWTQSDSDSASMVATFSAPSRMKHSLLAVQCGNPRL